MQKSYNFKTPVGVPGGLYDLTNYVSDARRNEEETGTMKFGMGVVIGSIAGKDVKLPSADSTLDNFEGVVQNGFNTEHTINGDVQLINKETVGVLRTGRIWARTAKNAVPAYGKSVYLIISGDEAGYFTTDEDSDSTKIAVNARFLGANGSGNCAPIDVWPNYPIAAE